MKHNLKGRIDHKKAIQLTADKLNVDPEQVKKVINGFFSLGGILVLIKHLVNFESVYIGSFFRTKHGHLRKQKMYEDNRIMKRNIKRVNDARRIANNLAQKDK